ncbi:MAG: formylmethanofuran dehydrogenase subunit C [Planctomycetota bacterium]|nr:formylmethanofuran dehydrogenase subunit C [Planctomycetaceae bacterium]MDQ3330478.1 formylmethanofuran dehydrogenase subunit C [Planctomycetota bacterium]
MSELVLTLRRPVPRRLDASPIAPDKLAGRSVGEIKNMVLYFEDGERTVIGAVFDVAGTASNDLRIVGALSRVDRLGTGMTSGILTIEGDAGHRVGDAMSGGRIEVAGDAGNFIGREMRGGEIIVRGDVGDGAGGASPGSKRGMTGGEIVVFGSAGARTGACMRRGVIAVGGDVGPGALRAAIAGTLVAFGNISPPAGRWSKRASLIALADVAIPPSYEYSCTYQPGFVRVLLTHLRRRYGLSAPPGLHEHEWYERYDGDMAELGRGEILRRLKI